LEEIYLGIDRQGFGGRTPNASAIRTKSAVYCWFKEGFDTLDPKEAKALADELAA
jgi:hypothetical protein